MKESRQRTFHEVVGVAYGDGGQEGVVRVRVYGAATAGGHITVRLLSTSLRGRLNLPLAQKTRMASLYPSAGTLVAQCRETPHPRADSLLDG